jgi:hypothetical protein
VKITDFGPDEQEKPGEPETTLKEAPLRPKKVEPPEWRRSPVLIVLILSAIFLSIVVNYLYFNLIHR